MKPLLMLLMCSIVCLGAKTGAIDALNVAGNGMLVQKYRLRTIAENIANVSTHMTDRGEPYRKKYVVVVPDKDGVRAAGIMESDAPFGQILDPSHVFADENGVLRTPNFELNDEMVTLSYANLLYEANTTAFKSSRQMFQNTLELLK
ncbi:MAG: flagellar basal body rod protein FlgC [Candidatus Margulisbacteria bacterium]|nr:flagellar basal body rod protein FlgC [Candidatus Margulisiibacteriota bacterium]